MPYAGNETDLRLIVKAGDPVRVKEIEFTGHPELNAKELRGALQGLRIRRVIPKLPGLWEGWRLFPAYSPEGVDAGAARLRSWYLSKGYFDVEVRTDDVELSHTDEKVGFVVQSGPRYYVHSWTVSRTGVDQPVAHAEGGALPEGELCSALFAERRDAESRGILDFSVQLNVQRTDDGSEATPTATIRADVDHGRPYWVRRIDFAGNHHYKDAFVRRNFLLDEGDPLDPLVLRKSMVRLNRSAAFEPVTEANVSIRTVEESGEATIMLQLIERKHNSWRLSGPVGPASIGGPLEASISSRLPAWGSGLFEMSTYAASLSLIGFAHPIVPVLSVVSRRPVFPVLVLQRPFFFRRRMEIGYGGGPAAWTAVLRPKLRGNTASATTDPDLGWRSRVNPGVTSYTRTSRRRGDHGLQAAEAEIDHIAVRRCSRSSTHGSGVGVLITEFEAIDRCASPLCVCCVFSKTSLRNQRTTRAR